MSGAGGRAEGRAIFTVPVAAAVGFGEGGGGGGTGAACCCGREGTGALDGGVAGAGGIAMFGATGRVGATGRGRGPDGAPPPTSTLRLTTTAGAPGAGGPTCGALGAAILVVTLFASFFSGTRFEKLIAERSRYQSQATARSQHMRSMFDRGHILTPRSTARRIR
jgi:hypothetical protein